MIHLIWAIYHRLYNSESSIFREGIILAKIYESGFVTIRVPISQIEIFASKAAESIFFCFTENRGE